MGPGGPGYGQGGGGYSPPPAGPVPPPVGATTPPPPKGRGGLGVLIAVLVVIVLIGGYFGIAAAAKLAPFTAAKSPTPTQTATPTGPAHTPTPTSTPTPAVAAQLILGNDLVFKAACVSATSQAALAEADANYDAVIIVINCTDPSLSALDADFSDGNYDMGDCATAQSLADCIPSYITDNATTCTAYSSSAYVNSDVTGQELCDLSEQGNPEDYALVVAFNSSTAVSTYYNDLLTENHMGNSQGTCSIGGSNGEANYVTTTSDEADYCANTFSNTGTGNQGSVFEWESPPGSAP